MVRAPRLLTEHPLRRTVSIALWIVASLLLTLALPAVGETAADGDSVAHWPSFRGPQARGIGDRALATQWNVEDGTNVLWSTPLPGLGHSSPVIWGDRLFITTAVAQDADPELKVGLYGDGWSADDKGPQSWRLLALDRNTGEILWDREALRGAPEIQRHPKASHANSTPATDGERVVAFFGSEGLFAFSWDGEPLWQKDFGVLHSGSYMMPVAQWGFGSSPVLHDGKVIVQVDVLRNSFLAVLDADNGEEIWRVDRDEFPGWGTPTIHQHGDHTQVLVNGFKHMGSYDLASGEALWKLSGGGDIPVPTPVVAHGLVFLTNAHGARSPVFAIDLDARGDLTEQAAADRGEAEEAEGDAASAAEPGVVWKIDRGGSYMQTPLAYGDELYVCRDNGVLSCFDAKSGERHYQERLASGEGFTASPVAAGGHVYFTSEVGDVHVLAAGTELDKVAVNSLGEIAMATPAIAGDTIYFRTRHRLLAIREGARLPPAAEAEGQTPDEGVETPGEASTDAR